MLIKKIVCLLIAHITQIWNFFVKMLRLHKKTLKQGFTNKAFEPYALNLLSKTKLNFLLKTEKTMFLWLLVSQNMKVCDFSLQQLEFTALLI